MSIKKRQLDLSFFTERRRKLSRDLKRVSHEQFVIVTQKIESNSFHLPSIRIDCRVRIKQTNLNFQVIENFLDIDTEPYLHSFSYSLEKVGAEAPLPVFRYECHPDSEDTIFTDDLETNKSLFDNINPYAIVPHFHPVKTTEYPFDRLHFPFHRSERVNVVFALVSWLEVDLINRFWS